MTSLFTKTTRHCETLTGPQAGKKDSDCVHERYTKSVWSAPAPRWNEKPMKRRDEQIFKFIINHFDIVLTFLLSYAARFVARLLSSVFLIGVTRFRWVYAMAGDNVSISTDSVSMSTGGRAVVLDTGFLQPISAVEFILTPVPVMSESSSVPDILQFRLREKVCCILRMTWMCQSIRMRSSITISIVLLLY